MFMQHFSHAQKQMKQVVFCANALASALRGRYRFLAPERYQNGSPATVISCVGVFLTVGRCFRCVLMKEAHSLLTFL